MRKGIVTHSDTTKNIDINVIPFEMQFLKINMKPKYNLNTP